MQRGPHFFSSFPGVASASSRVRALLSGLCLLTGISVGGAEFLAETDCSAPSEQSFAVTSAPQTEIWAGDIGEGFRKGAESLGVNFSGGFGVQMFGSHQAHDLGFGALEYGRLISRTLGEGRWFRGNFEFGLEFFAGSEFRPRHGWLVGMTPHLRYDLATSTRWVPFIDAGAGVAATSIGPPDLSGTFEFNLQASVGVRRFITDILALTVEARFLHMSCAGISSPNAGLNDVLGTIGVSWFF